MTACVVTAPAAAGGERRLVAHVVSAETTASPDELRRFLQQALPAHMVPTTFVFLAALPLTSNGKVD